MASRIPDVIDVGRPTPATAPASAAGRASPPPVPVASARRAARRAGTTLTAETATSVARAPIPSTGQSAAMPGSGSAMRASPSGMSGDASTATPTAAAAPPAPTSTALASETEVRAVRDMPSARSVGNSSPRASISRASACPKIATPANPRSPEAAQSVTTGTRFTACTSGVYTEAGWGGAARGISRRRISSANAGRSASPRRSTTCIVSSSVSAAGRWARKNAGVSLYDVGEATASERLEAADHGHHPDEAERLRFRLARASCVTLAVRGCERKGHRVPRTQPEPLREGIVRDRLVGRFRIGEPASDDLHFVGV